MDRYHYAPDPLVRALKLKFEQPEPRSVEAFEATLHQMLDTVGAELEAVLQADRLTDTIPADGLLKKPLNDDQKSILNEALTLPYARRNLEQQEELFKVPIEENEEPMVRLSKVLDKDEVQVSYSDRPILDVCGPNWGNKERVKYMRESSARKLFDVCRGLNQINCQAHIEDAWRHREVQEGLFIRRIVDLARQYPKWSWQDVLLAAKSFTASSPGLAGHMAGSAVDLRIWDIKQKDFLPLGNGYADGGATSSLDFPYLTQGEWETRMLFVAVMRAAGLKLLRTENWHGSHGDRGLGLDARVHIRRAVHGPIKAFSRSTGEVEPMVSGNLDQCFLADAEVEDLVDQAREKVAGNPVFTTLQLAENVRRTHYPAREQEDQG